MAALTQSQQATFNDMTQNYGMSPAQALSAMGQAGATTVAEATGASSGGGSTATSTPSTSSTASSGGSSSGGTTSSGSNQSALDAFYDIHQRSQITGVPTAEYNAAAKAAGFDVVNDPLSGIRGLKSAGYQTAMPTYDAVIKYGAGNEQGSTGNSAFYAGGTSYDIAAQGPEAYAQYLEDLKVTQNGVPVNQLDPFTGSTSAQATGSNDIASIYQTELGRAPDQGGLDFYTGIYNDLVSGGLSEARALDQIRLEIDQSQEGANYDTKTPANQNMGLDGTTMGSYEQYKTNAGLSVFDRSTGETWDQFQARLAQQPTTQPTVDPITGMPLTGGAVQPTTGATGGKGGATSTELGFGADGFGTGGTTAQPVSSQLTPFQQASLAQSQALLGTMEAQAGPFGRLATTDYNRYMNPYTTGVIDTTMQDLERQRLMQQNQIGAQATAAGAYGGSRHGVAEALTNEAMQRTMANTAAQQRQAGFQQAQTAAQADISNEMAQRQFGLGAAQQMSGLGQTSYNYGTGINAMLSGAGAQQQAAQQAVIDAAKGQYGAYTSYPSTGAGIFSQILGSAPSGQTSTYNPGVMDYLTLAASAYGASDIRLKKNIKKVGELANGLGVYTWEWKDKVKEMVGNFSMTKGVMAQEAMEVIPEAVKTAPNGYLMVDYSHPELSGVA